MSTGFKCGNCGNWMAIDDYGPFCANKECTTIAKRAPEVPASPVTGPATEAIKYLRAIFGKRTDEEHPIMEFLDDTPKAQDQGFTKWAAQKALNILEEENGKA